MRFLSWVLSAGLVAGLPAALVGQLTSSDVSGILADANNPQSEYAFGRLLARFQADDPRMTLTEVLRLYLGYTLQPEYDPSDKSDLLLYRKYQDGKYDQVIQGARQILVRNPVSLSAHLLLALSFEKQGNPDQSALYGHRYSKLLKAIYVSGTGRTPQSAFHTIAASDIYRVLSEMSLQPEDHNIRRIDDQYYDVLRVRLRGQDQPYELYFNITVTYGNDEDSLLQELAEDDIRNDSPPASSSRNQP